MSGPPPGYRISGDSSELPPGYSITPPPAYKGSGEYDLPKLKSLWTQAGGDPKDAEIMARVALAESGGNPKAINSYVDGGKTYHPRGLWQVSDIHPHGSSFDPVENARAAVELHRAQGLKPWEDSRSKGGGGGWGQYIGRAASNATSGPPPGYTIAGTEKPRPASQFNPPHEQPHQNPMQALFGALNQPLAGTASASETRPPPGYSVSSSPPMPDPRPHATFDQRAPVAPLGGVNPQGPVVKAAGSAGSGLGVLMDYTQLGLAPQVAFARDIQYQHEQRASLKGSALADFNRATARHERAAWPNQAQLAASLKTGGLGPQNVHGIAERTDITAPGPGAIGQNLPPLAKMAIGGVSQALNPTSYIGGPVKLAAGLAGKGTGKALEPITRALDAAQSKIDTNKVLFGDTAEGRVPKTLTSQIAETRANMAPFSGLRRVAKEVGADPDKAEQIGRSVVGARNLSQANASHAVKQIFDGLTRQQRIEVERLSEGLAPRIPDPHGTLAQRGQMQRAAIVSMTNEQTAVDLLTPGRTFDVNTYTSRSGPQGEVYASAITHPDVVELYGDLGRGSGTGRATAAVKGTSAQSGKSKVFENYDEAEASGKLAPGYDPANNLMRYLTLRGKNVALEHAARDFQAIGMMPKMAVVNPATGNIIGYGADGAKAAEAVGERNAKRVGHGYALDEVNAARVARGEKPLSEVEMFAKRRAVAGQSRAADRVIQAQQNELARATMDKASAAKYKAISDAYNFSKASEADVRAYQQAFNIGKEGVAVQTRESIMGASREAAGHLGYGAAELAKTGLPTMEFAISRPAVVRFFVDQGATENDARGVAALADGMNRLARIGIITNPVVHAGWNLGNHFLAAGGSPEFFIKRAWTDPQKWEGGFSHALGRQMTGVDWLAEAEKNNAVIHMSDSHGLFGGDFGVTLTGPKVMSKAGYHERGLMGTLDAGATKLWQANQRVVFDAFEKRYSVALFQHFVENEGMTPAKAGIQVRKALGDYANISKGKVEQGLSKTFLFYPWFKTAVPFWAKTVATKPQFITVPGIGLRRWDEAMGDPNVGSEGPFTMDLGANADGSRKKMSVPYPGKWAADLLEIVAPHGQLDGGLIQRGTVIGKVAEGHLAPWSAVGVTEPLAHTLWAPPSAPGGASFSTVADKREDAGTQAKQAGQFYAGRLPFAGLAHGVTSTAGSVAGGDPRALAGMAGGFQYDRLAPADERRLGRINAKFDQQMKHAATVGRHNPQAGANLERVARNLHATSLAAFQRDMTRRKLSAKDRGPAPAATPGPPAGYTLSP